jgi:hypothetical protein
MMNFLEKLTSIVVAFFIGCYVTASYLDKPFVEMQKTKIKNQIENLIFGELR